MPIEMFKRHETLCPGRAASGLRRQNIALSRVAGPSPALSGTRLPGNGKFWRHPELSWQRQWQQ